VIATYPPYSAEELEWAKRTQLIPGEVLYCEVRKISGLCGFAAWVYVICVSWVGERLEVSACVGCVRWVGEWADSSRSVDSFGTHLETSPLPTRSRH
jgi:hypothetical protein